MELKPQEYKDKHPIKNLCLFAKPLQISKIISFLGEMLTSLGKKWTRAKKLERKTNNYKYCKKAGKSVQCLALQFFWKQRTYGNIYSTTESDCGKNCFQIPTLSYWVLNRENAKQTSKVEYVRSNTYLQPSKYRIHM